MPLRRRNPRLNSSISAAHCAIRLVLSIDQRKLVDIIARLTHEARNSKARIGIESSAGASLGTGLQSPASASNCLDVEVPGLAVALTSAEHSPSPALAGVESQRDGSSAGATVGEAGAVSELDADGVEALGAAERDHGCCCWSCGQLGQAAEPVAGWAAGEATLAE